MGCETEYIEQCTTEYTDECWDEHQDICHTHPECHTTYVDHCEPIYKKKCHGGGKKKGKKFKRDVAEELVHSEDDDEDLEDIKKMSTAELLDIMPRQKMMKSILLVKTERSVTLPLRFTNCLRRVRRRKSVRLFIMASIVRRFQCRTVTTLRNVRKRFTVSARKFPTRNVGKSLTRNVGKYPMRLALMFPMKNAGMNHVNLA